MLHLPHRLLLLLLLLVICVFFFFLFAFGFGDIDVEEKSRACNFCIYHVGGGDPRREKRSDEFKLIISSAQLVEVSIPKS